MFENVPTVSMAERQQVIGALERLQVKLTQREELALSQSLGSLREALQSPLLANILTLQSSLKQLRNQLSSIPPDACSDISFSSRGQLIVSASHPASSQSPAAATPPPGSASSSPLPAEGSSWGSGSPAPLSSEWLSAVAKGRDTDTVRLCRPSHGGLGFSVIGLSPEASSAPQGGGPAHRQGVFVKHIQPGGVAHRQGGLRVGDQVLAVNGCPVDQHSAVSLLQKASSDQWVELVVARARTHPAPDDITASPPLPPTPPQAPPLVNTEDWGEVEQIDLVNDGSGLGFGIVGGKTTGVVVRTLVPNSVAHKDGRLRTGDHILSIGDTPTAGLASEQVVKVLQGCGPRVTMLVARQPRPHAPDNPPIGMPMPPPPPSSAPVSALCPPPPPPELPRQPPDTRRPPQRRVSKTPNLDGYEIQEVSLTKKEGQSLGISIIGYNALTSHDAVGVFVKHVVPGSAAEQSGNIKVHDRLIALDGVSVQGFTNQEVLEVMRQTGDTVHLTLVRKMRQERSLDRVERESSRMSLTRSLEVKTRSSDVSDPTHTSRAAESSSVEHQELRSKWEQALGPQYQVLVVVLDAVIEDDAELQKYSKLLPIHAMRLGVELDSFDGHHYVSSVAPGGPADRHGALRPEDEVLEVNGVQLYGKSRREAVGFLREVPPPFTLVCCRHPGTMDDHPATMDDHPATSEDHPETSEDHPETSETIDEHLETNDDHPATSDYQPDIDPHGDLDPQPELESWTAPTVDEIELKLSSLLASQTRQTDTCLPHRQQTDSCLSERQQEEAEPPGLSQQEEDEDEDEDEDGDSSSSDGGELALWSPDVLTVELQKDSERGMGFSILDYQDPVDPSRCVMVIRSLVGGGAAERHGSLLPGDQLTSVNEHQLDRLTLEQAVEVLKAAPPGTVRLGIRKPLVVEGTDAHRQALSDIQALGQTDSLSVSLNNTPLPVPKGFGDGSILPEDLLLLLHRDEEDDDDDEPELILDSAPRYISSPLMLPLPPPPSSSPLIGCREMAVDESEEEEDEEAPPPPPPPYPSSSSLLPPAGPEGERVEPTHTPLMTAVHSRDSEADSELTLTDTDSENVRVIDTEGRRKRRGQAPPIRGGAHSDLPEREAGEGEETPAFSHWGPARRVEVCVSEGQSLGLSIVGGHHVIKRLRNGEELKGIFIKHVLIGSPADHAHKLKTGDKILEVSGVDLQSASHEEAVQAIKSAGSPVVFTVQSLCTTPRPLSSATRSKKSTAVPKVAVAPPTVRQPPPYRPPSQSEQPFQPPSQLEDPYRPPSQSEEDPDLVQARGTHIVGPSHSTA